MNREPTEAKRSLEAILSPEAVRDEPETLDVLARDESFVPGVRPRFVVRVQSAEQVQSLVRWANETKTPLVPISSNAPHHNGDTVPSAAEAVVVDLSGMKRILSVNRQHRVALIEPGVTYGELQAALAKQGMTLASCLAPREGKSVVASLLELEPRLNAMHQWAFTDPLRCMEVTWGDGKRMYTGEAGGGPMDLETQWSQQKWQVEPVGPMMLDFYRLLTGAQGSMGIVTWASVRCELLHGAHTSRFVASDDPDALMEFVRRVTCARFSEELFMLNRGQLAALLANDAEQYRTLREGFPAYIALVGMGGRDLLPEERMAQQLADIGDIAARCGLSMSEQAGGVSAARAIARASGVCRGEYWKNRPYGAHQDLFFLTTAERIGAFAETMRTLASECGYDARDIGAYVQPVHCGSAYHLSFTIPYHEGLREQARRLFFSASERMAAMGAYYSRPYGIWADLQMNRDAAGKKALETIKGIFDPNRIMNPGKLCL